MTWPWSRPWCKCVRIACRSPTTERYHEVTPRRRRFSPSSDDVTGVVVGVSNNNKRALTRPRSLVFDSSSYDVDNNAEISFEASNVAKPIKKYKSVVVLRETPSSYRTPISTDTNRWNMRLTCTDNLGELKSFLATSVTRFGEILPLWYNFKTFGQFLRVYLVFGNI